jgi:hypothetical protein
MRSTRCWSAREHNRAKRVAVPATWTAYTKGGGAGLAGVRAPVLRCACRTKDGGMRLLTTQRRSKGVHERGRSDSDENQ